MIIRNSAKCNKCGDEIESKHRHDFVCCSCGGICVDGGRAYLRRATKVESGYGYVDTSIVKEDQDDK